MKAMCWSLMAGFLSSRVSFVSIAESFAGIKMPGNPKLTKKMNSFIPDVNSNGFILVEF